MEPLLSVIVPTHARPRALARCLCALNDQDLPANRYEVIVVDDGASGQHPARIDLKRDGLAVHLLRQERAGPAAARNRGAAQSCGSLLVFTDDDCAPDPGWLSALARAHSEDPAAALGGHTINAVRDNPYSEVSQLLIDYLYLYFETTPLRFVTSNNLAVPACAFHEVGGFGKSFPLAAGEDREFCDRWIRAGRPLRYVPEAVVEHHHELTLSRFLRQHFTYGRGAFHFHRVRAQRGLRRSLEPPRFYVGLMLYPFSQQPPIRALVAAGLLTSTQAANAAGFFWERWRNRRSPRANGERSKRWLSRE